MHNKIIFSCFYALFLASNFAGLILAQEQTWAEIKAEETFLFDLYAFDANTAITVSTSGKVMKTKNGGQTWHVQEAAGGITVNWLGAIDFIDDSTGWTVGRDGVILKTTDQGETWHSQSLAPDKYLWEVTFVDSLTGWIAASRDTLYTTQDGGATWQVVNVGERSIRALYFFDKNHGWVVNDGITYHTVDGGETWQIQSNAWTAYPVNAFFFSDQDYGWAVGGDSTIVHTSDGGGTWDIISRDVRHEGWAPSVFHAVSFVDKKIGWIAGSEFGVILKTTDAGATWEEQHWKNRWGMEIKTIQCIDANMVWAAGSNSEDGQPSYPIVLRTTDGGATWFEPDGTPVSVQRFDPVTERIPDQKVLLQNYPNPFNPRTRIVYDLPVSGRVHLEIYNVQGRQVERIDLGQRPSGVGNYDWLALDRNGNTLPCGLYLNRLILHPDDGRQPIVQQVKMILAR